MQPSNPPPGRVYFPGLNGLRFLAAFSVLIHHTETVPSRYGLPARHILSPFCLSGRDGVTLFFVLSGFLITYLLLAEQAASGSIQIGRFYFRRVLRIWPLYYLAVLIGFVLIPATVCPPAFALWTRPDVGLLLALFLFMLPNVAMCFFPPAVVGSALLWSVGVEEQFYLVWPHVVRRAGRYLLLALFGVLLGKLAVHAGLTAWLGTATPFASGLNRLLHGARVECMALGGIGAYLVHTRWRLLPAVYHPVTQVAAWLVVVAVLLPWSGAWRLPDAVIGVVFLVVLLNVACNPRPLITLENRWFDFGGKLSYGIYIFHPLLMCLICSLLIRVGWITAARPTTRLVVLLLDAATVLGTVGVAALSYRYFEAPFLRLKDQFAVVPSGKEESSGAARLAA